MIPAWLKVGLVAAVFAFGWYVRGLKADRDMADFKNGLAAQAQDQRELAGKIDASRTGLREQSTARLDQQGAEQQKEIHYVDREVIRFRDRWRDRACELPADWLQLYNRSLGVDAGAVPGTAAAGSASTGDPL